MGPIANRTYVSSVGSLPEPCAARQNAVGDWRRLLAANRGQELHFDVSVKGGTGQWESFSTITNRIAGAPIDGYPVYGKMYPVYR